MAFPGGSVPAREHVAGQIDSKKFRCGFHQAAGARERRAEDIILITDLHLPPGKQISEHPRH